MKTEGLGRQQIEAAAVRGYVASESMRAKRSRNSMDVGTGGKRFQFSRLRSVFRVKPNEKKKDRQDNTGREEEPTFEIWHKQARPYKRSKRLLSYSA